MNLHERIVQALISSRLIGCDCCTDTEKIFALPENVTRYDALADEIIAVIPNE